ncbi:MAG: transporter [Deltaproteobacteria bacterium]|nr:transporter [Deltaproteobacteria bacterium]
MKNFLLFVFFCFIPLSASAFYQPEYQNRGNTNFLDAVCPKPGFLFQNFFFHFKSVRLKNNHSHTIPGKFKLSVNTNLSNFIYVSSREFLGGLVGAELIVPVINGHLTTDSPQGVVRDNDHGIGDIFAGGVIQWKKTTLIKFPYYHRFLAGVVFPTGEYDHKKLFNVGYNFYTFHLYYTFTLFLTSELTTSWRLQYNFHTENHEYGIMKDDLKPGELFNVNFSSCYEIKKGIRLGMVGHYWKQTTDDEINGNRLKVGKEQVLGIGPAIILNRKNIFLSFQTLFDTLAKSRPEGNS